MKKLLLIFVFTQIIAVASAQVSIRVNVDAPGGLSYSITDAGGNFSTITNLTITGTIDARDFKTMRDKMPALTVIDLSSASIEAYKGDKGTADGPGNPFESAALAGSFDGIVGTGGRLYPANAIPSEAFSNHSIQKKKSRFTSITIPSTATSIDGNAFFRCNGLTSFTIPGSVTSIKNNAFFDCSSLTSVTLSGQIANIGVSAFSGCSGLTSITIPRSLISIDYGAFSGSNIIFTVDADNTQYSSINGVLFNKAQTRLMQCPISKKGSYTIPKSITSIGVGAFENCKFLSEISIPKSVTSIEASAFHNCSGITSISIPNSVTCINAWAFSGCSGLTSVTIPNSVIDIQDGAFSGCSSLTSVTIPNSITAIRQNVFQECAGLTSVSIPGSVTSIGIQAFSGCKGFTSVTIPGSVKSIGMWAFSGCSGLISVAIPGSVTSMELTAFFGSSGDFLVDAENTKYSSVDGVLFDKTQTTLLQCPSSKKGSYSIPNTVTSIGEGAFVECSKLTSIVIHNKVKSINRGSFAGSSAIISVDTNNSNYSSFDGILFDKKQTVLMHCPTSRTGSYTIPNTVNFISDFQQCIGLTSIIIPKSVTTIGGSCFNNCSGLTSITVKSSTPVELSTFVSVFHKIDKKSCKLYVPVGSKSLYQAANQWKDFENIIETNLN